MLPAPSYVLRTMICSLIALTALTGCAANNAETKTTATNQPGSAAQTITILSPKAPSLIPALVMEQQEAAAGQTKVETWDTLEQLMARVQQKDAPFFAAPINVGANMYAKGLPLQLLHVNTWGSMYLISLDPTVSGLSQLENETVYIPGQSGPPDILTRYLLQKEGVEGKVNLAYGVLPDIMQQLAAGTIKHAVLPEPVLSGLRVKLDGKVNEVVDYQKTWRAEFGEDLPQTGMFVNPEWAKAHPKEVADFQQSYRLALQKAIEEPQETVKLAAAAFAMPEAALTQAMPNMSLIFKDAQAARPEVERYLTILLSIAPDSIGGALPDAGFYYSP